VDHDAFVRELETHLGDVAGGSETRELSPPQATLTRSLMHRATEQAHFCMGVSAVDENDPDRWAVRVLNLILGGGMSSRLFQEIREKRGLCYSIASEAMTFREGGLFVVYADTSRDQMEEVFDLVRQELLNAARTGVTSEELARAKEQIRAATLLALDDVASRMNRLARSLLYHGRIVPLSELVAIVEALTVEDCRRMAERLFGGGEFAFAAIGPFGKRKRRA
jgi:predicted Zn-dependent peptidase